MFLGVLLVGPWFVVLALWLVVFRKRRLRYGEDDKERRP